VLELACGSGRVTFTLATALPKAQIVGVDSSIEMLGKAAAVGDAAEPSVRERVSLVEGDMRDWPGTGDQHSARDDWRGDAGPLRPGRRPWNAPELM
jgi:trans-aconitate 2-methyltransferase